MKRVEVLELYDRGEIFFTLDGEGEGQWFGENLTPQLCDTIECDITDGEGLQIALTINSTKWIILYNGRYYARKEDF